MIFKTLLLIIFTSSLSSSVIPEYKAKYKFERDDFSITGIRELKKSNNDDFIFKFNANTLLIVSMNFESIFEIKDSKIITKNYEVKIRPKSVDRDQKISFDYDNFKINSSGRNSWVASLDQTAFLTDPLNAQIQIRLNLISGMKKFYINLIEMETGEIQENLYELDGETLCKLQDKNYDCVILKRFRESDDRITTYYLIPELSLIHI